MDVSNYKRPQLLRYFISFSKEIARTSMIDYMFGNSNWAESLPSDYDKFKLKDALLHHDGLLYIPDGPPWSKFSKTCMTPWLQIILDSTKLPTIVNPCITMVFNLHELHHRSLSAFQLIQLHFGDHGSLDKNGYLNKTKLRASQVINKGWRTRWNQFHKGAQLNEILYVLKFYQYN